MHRNPLRAFHDIDSSLGWRGTPLYEGRFVREDFDVNIRSDASGFRVPGHAVAVDSKAKRIAVLGDSFTWGWGVAQGEVLTDQMQRLLGESFRVMNYGVNAYGTGQEMILLRELLENWEFDSVLVLHYENDWEDNVDSKKGRRPWFLADGERLVAMNSSVRADINSVGRRMERNSHAFSWIRYSLNSWSAARKSAHSKRNKAESGTQQIAWQSRQVQRLLLAEMQRACDEQGIPLRVVRIPAKAEMRAEPGEGPSLLREISSELNLPYLDLREAFQAHEAARLYFEHDGHWSKDGHELAGARVAEWISGGR